MSAQRRLVRWRPVTHIEAPMSPAEWAAFDTPMTRTRVRMFCGMTIPMGSNELVMYAEERDLCRNCEVAFQAAESAGGSQ